MARRSPPKTGRRSPPTSGRKISERGQWFHEIDPADSGDFSGEPAFAFTKILANSANFAETILPELGRALANSMAFAGDPAFGFTRPLTNTFAATDTGTLLMQDYCEPTYFGGDYTGTSATFS